MTTKTDLETIAETIRDLPRVRGEVVARARAEGMTWHDIATRLDMTDAGLIRAQQRYEATLVGAK